MLSEEEHKSVCCEEEDTKSPPKSKPIPHPSSLILIPACIGCWGL